jgi:hypothetical protein
MYSDFTGAILDSLTLGHTVLACVSLSRAKGLETCNHKYPSVIDHLTLKRSGVLPRSFLRGCGLPEELIKRVRMLYGLIGSREEKSKIMIR